MSQRDASADDVWADLVARLEATDSSSLPDDDHEPAPRPGADDQDGPHGRATDDDPGADAPDRPADEPRFPSLAGPTVGPLASRGPRDWDEPDEEELAAAGVDDFVPEEPGPILVGRPGVVIACIAAIGLPVLMLVLLIVAPGRVPGTGWAALGLTTVIALVYLAWHLPRNRSDDSDDGARV